MAAGNSKFKKGDLVFWRMPYSRDGKLFKAVIVTIPYETVQYGIDFAGHEDENIINRINRTVGTHTLGERLPRYSGVWTKADRLSPREIEVPKDGLDNWI